MDPKRVPKPASGADVAKLHRQKRLASAAFADADRAYDEALRVFESAVIRKDAARKNLAAANDAYYAAKSETEGL
ncbi:hypothetical protein [Pseudarthrobacter cellobiosi]|uniref:hypothetical protein n=1 Tax=Pseudarthrobacter cellobiosi TaxID=2953654 RepID=UPI00208F6BBC|nr:hypothetical protein [Pseudarthrobacter sp. HLT1-5]MCO4257378.1 hypothetical protein [Pseudarthrobacter sp. HLT1-5]